MSNQIFKELKNSIFNKKFQNIGYLPRWIIFAIDVFIVGVSCGITEIIIHSLSVKFTGVFNEVLQGGLILFVNALFLMVYRTYAGIIRQ